MLMEFFSLQERSFDKHCSSQNLSKESMIDILEYGCDKINEYHNKEILHTIDYIQSTKRLERPIIDHCLL